jgi:hypothetical protein
VTDPVDAVDALAEDVDPGVVALVDDIRDRFGLFGLIQASSLIAAEIQRTARVTDEAFNDGT